MKINTTKIQNYKLFKYNLLKLQIYSNKMEKHVSDVSTYTLEQIEAYFKQALKIIFEYHKKQFKILFVGFPIVSKLKQIKLIHFTNHNFISQKSWISGIFRNRFSILSYLTSLKSQNFSKKLKLLLTIKAKPHLIVIFSPEIETNVINEFYKTGVPILSFNWNVLDSSKTTYKVLGNFNFIEKNLRITYFFLLYSILKKTPLKKNTIEKEQKKNKEKVFRRKPNTNYCIKNK
jgi:ribosomal protein S2